MEHHNDLVHNNDVNKLCCAHRHEVVTRKKANIAKVRRFICLFISHLFTEWNEWEYNSL